MWGLRPCCSGRLLAHNSRGACALKGILGTVLRPQQHGLRTARSRLQAASPQDAVATLPAQQQQQQQQQQGSTIYNNPQLYEDAFSYRDIPAEAKFLQEVYKRHCKGSKLSSFLELACGPAAHTIQLAKQQPKLQATGLDLSQTMLAHARSKAEQAGVTVTFVQADMASFELEERLGRFDMVACLLGSLSHLLDNHTAAAAVKCAAKHLRPGGLLLLELAHPGDLWDGTLLLGDTGGEMWEVDKGGRKLQVEWGTEMDAFDLVSQVLQRTVSISELSEDGTSGTCLAEEVVDYRQFTLQEVELLGMLAGLEVVSTYGDMQADVDLNHEDAYRMVVVLQRH